MMFYSKSTKTFYDSNIHLEIPKDAKQIPEKDHRELFAGQEIGSKICFPSKGKPTLESKNNN